METDGVLKLGVPKSSQVVPTSPHEIAASLCSNVQKKLKNEKDRSSGTEEIEEAKGATKSNSITGSSGNTSSKVTGPSKHVKQQYGNRSPQKAGAHSKPPTTLSLDAAPFYPSADFQQKMFRGRTDQQHHKQKYGNTLGDYIPPSLNAPPGFSPDEAGMAFASSIPSERKYRKWGMDHPQHHSKGTTPPPFPSALGDNHQYHLESPGLDPQEPFGYSSDPPFYDAVEDPQALYTAGGVTGVGRMRRSGRGAADPRDSVPSRLHPLESDPVLAAALIKRQQQQQQLQQQQILAAHRRAARERIATAYPAPSQSSLWDHPNSYQLQALQEEEELALQQHQQQQRQLLQRQYYHQQARRSAEALSSLNQPLSYRPRRSAVLSPELNQPSSASLWDGLDFDLSSQHSLDDSFLSEAVHAQQLRQQQLLQEQVSRTARHATTRRRTYSGESDLGGEIVTNLHAAHETSTSVNPPGLNRAPGTFSGYDQPRRARSSQTSALQSGWPADFTEVRHYYWTLMKKPISN